MATPIILPKLGNTVESSIILRWNKSAGDQISEGEILCEVETDKATMEVESPVSGTLLALLFDEGDDVPVLANIAVVGELGESFEEFQRLPNDDNSVQVKNSIIGSASTSTTSVVNDNANSFIRISPRAKNLAEQKQLDIRSIVGTGPMGRIIERDIELVLKNTPSISPVAKAMLQTGEYTVPKQGTGNRGRITKADLIPSVQQSVGTPELNADDVEVIPLKGIRKTIAERMLESIQTTAQLTLSTSVPAQALLDMRKWLKDSPKTLNLRSITINDLIMYAVVKTLPEFLGLNMIFENDTIYQYRNVHLGFAVDTPRGLVVPVIRNANSMNLTQLADEAHRLTDATVNQRITPDEMTGGTFTLSNLGNLGIEVFTPVINLPQVAILGVGSITTKPIPVDDGYDFAPYITLSLTINHQVVDGAPAARFLQTLSQNIAIINEL